MTLAQLLSDLGVANVGSCLDTNSTFQLTDQVIFQNGTAQIAVQQIVRSGSVQTTVPSGVSTQPPQVLISLH